MGMNWLLFTKNRRWMLEPGLRLAVSRSMIPIWWPTTSAGLAPPVLPAWPGYDQARRALAHPSPDPRAVPVPARLDPLNLQTHFPNAGRTGSRPPNPQSRDEDR